MSSNASTTNPNEQVHHWQRGHIQINSYGALHQPNIGNEFHVTHYERSKTALIAVAGSSCGSFTIEVPPNAAVWLIRATLAILASNTLIAYPQELLMDTLLEVNAALEQDRRHERTQRETIILNGNYGEFKILPSTRSLNFLGNRIWVANKVSYMFGFDGETALRLVKSLAPCINHCHHEHFRQLKDVLTRFSSY